MVKELETKSFLIRFEMTQENAEAVKNPKFGEKSIKRVSPVDGDGHHVHQRRSHVAVKEEWKNSGEKKIEKR